MCDGAHLIQVRIELATAMRGDFYVTLTLDQQTNLFDLHG